MAAETKDYTHARYWAITGIGYGKGDSPEEAVENYRSTQARNFGMSPEEVDQATWGRIWKAPEGATGFVADGEIHWEIGDEYVTATSDQVVGDVGAVPDWAKR